MNDTNVAMGPLKFHHVGVACNSIDDEALRLAALGYVAEGPRFVDPKQGVQGLFLGSQSPRLELLEPLGDSGVLTPWLKGGTKLYHLAYEVADMTGAIEGLRSRRAKLVVPPVAAVAFAQRHIAFLMLPNQMLIELIEEDVGDR